MVYNEVAKMQRSYLKLPKKHITTIMHDVVASLLTIVYPIIFSL